MCLCSYTKRNAIVGLSTFGLNLRLKFFPPVISVMDVHHACTWVRTPTHQQCCFGDWLALTWENQSENRGNYQCV